MLRNSERAYSGNCFVLDSGAVTLASANATKSALGTAKLINGFYNPVGSGLNARILRIIVATTSGTAAGPFFYNFLTGKVINTSAAGTIRGANPLFVKPSIVMPLVNVTLTTAASDTDALLQLCTIGGPAAIASGAGIYTVVDEPVVPIEVVPGEVFGLMAAGAGTTHIVQSTIFWEEVGF